MKSISNPSSVISNSPGWKEAWMKLKGGEQVEISRRQAVKLKEMMSL